MLIFLIVLKESSWLTDCVWRYDEFAKLGERVMRVIRELKQGGPERCLKILFPVTVKILQLLQVARLGKCEYTFQE